MRSAHRGIVGVRQEGVLDHDAGAAAGLQRLDEMLEEEEGGLAGLDREILLHLLALLAAEGRIGEDHVVAVLVLDVADVLGQRVGADDVRRVDAVQDHVHDRRSRRRGASSPCRRRSSFEACAGLGRKLVAICVEIVEGLAEKARRAAGAVIDALADLRLDDLDHGADERARRVIFAAVPARIAHVAELGFVEVRKLVLLLLRAEAERVDEFERVAQRVAALELVFDFAEDLADLVFDRVGALGALLEALQVREQLAVDEVDEIVAGQRLVVIE